MWSKRREYIDIIIRIIKIKVGFLFLSFDFDFICGTTNGTGNAPSPTSLSPSCTPFLSSALSSGFSLPLALPLPPVVPLPLALPPPLALPLPLALTLPLSLVYSCWDPLSGEPSLALFLVGDWSSSLPPKLLESISYSGLLALHPGTHYQKMSIHPGTHYPGFLPSHQNLLRRHQEHKESHLHRYKKTKMIMGKTANRLNVRIASYDVQCTSHMLQQGKYYTCKIHSKWCICEQNTAPSI